MMKKPPAVVSPQEVSNAIRKLKLETARQEAAAMQHRAIARRRLSAIANDLMPVAAGYARRGKPRLLAVLARILDNDELDTKSAAVIKAAAQHSK